MEQTPGKIVGQEGGVEKKEEMPKKILVREARGYYIARPEGRFDVEGLGSTYDKAIINLIEKFIEINRE